MANKVLDYVKYSTSIETFIKEILELDVEWFHREWLETFENNNFISLLAPRGHGKTFMVSSYLLWKILINPDIRILMVTINQDKANEIMAFIQRHLEANERIKEIFGDQKGTSDWSKSTLRVLQSSGKYGKEPTFQVLGVTSSMVGGHYDIIILDDVTDQKNSRTEYRRKELVRWFNSTLMPMLEPQGTIVSIGTKWHQSDIHSYLAKLPNYTSNVYKAIIEEPTEENKEGVVLWPNRWTYDKLQEIKLNYGNVAFMMQYQNEFISDEESPIKFDWVQDAVDGYKIPKPPYDIYMGVDLASKGEESDYFTISIVAIQEGLVYLLDGYRDHISMHAQFEKIKYLYNRWEPLKIGIEQAAQQKMIIEALIEESPYLPVIPIKSSIVNDRMSRVQRLSVLFETRRIFINPQLISWIDEFISFPRGSYDDTIDSVSFAIQASQDLEGESTIDWERMPRLISLGRGKKGETGIPSKKKPNVFHVKKVR